MDTEQQQKKDHDLIVTLVEAFKNLKESQDKFHCEMKEAMKDLKDNYSTKIMDLSVKVDTLQEQVERLKLWRSGIVACVALIAFVLTFCSNLFSNLIH